MASIYEADYMTVPAVSDVEEPYLSVKEIPAMIQKLKQEMKEAAGRLEFERAAEIRGVTKESLTAQTRENGRRCFQELSR